MPDDPLRAHLVSSRLAGAVATSPGNTLSNCSRLAAGEPKYTFGLWADAPPCYGEAVEAIGLLCGDPHGLLADGIEAYDEDVHGAGRYLGDGWIDPDLTCAAIDLHRRRLAEAAAGRVRVLLATGHPTGLLPHYAALGRALTRAGCTLLHPRDDVVLPAGSEPHVESRTGPRMRFLDGVACLTNGGDLLHTHLPDGMKAMLAELGGAAGVDLVLADHGMAGAAVAAGIPTLSIADVNDPALPLAQVRGRTDGVLVIDDNLTPSLFVPVTQAMLRWEPKGPRL